MKDGEEIRRKKVAKSNKVNKKKRLEKELKELNGEIDQLEKEIAKIKEGGNKENETKK